MHPYAYLAKSTVEEYVRNGSVLKPPPEIPDDMKRRAGVFVCLKSGGHLRGCIGTFQPSRNNLYEEIVRNAISASTEDPRFSAVSPQELGELGYTVDILSDPEKISELSELDPKKYGIIVVKGSRRGLLLPDLDGVETIGQQLEIAKTKAGIAPLDPDVDIYRFLVERYK